MTFIIMEAMNQVKGKRSQGTASALLSACSHTWCKPHRPMPRICGTLQPLTNTAVAGSTLVYTLRSVTALTVIFDQKIPDDLIHDIHLGPAGLINDYPDAPLKGPVEVVIDPEQ
jgi:hypothetical protein